MHSIHRSLAALAMFLALVSFAPVAAASTHHPFHLDKTCAEDLSQPLGYICTVQHSDFKWIPTGTDVHYLSQNSSGDVVQLSIEIANGRTDGTCTWTSERDATCVFDAGTGRLTQLHLDVVVTANADESVWYWDGTYWFGRN